MYVKKPILILFFSVINLAYGQDFYQRNSSQTPLLRKNGETEFSILVGRGEMDFIKSIECQGAYAMNEKLALFVNYYGLNAKEKPYGPWDSTGNLNGHGLKIEVAAGYFKSITKHSGYELFGGLGLGQTKINSIKEYAALDINGDSKRQYVNSRVSNNIANPFLQINYGYRYPCFDALLSMKIGLMHIGNIQISEDDLKDTIFRKYTSALNNTVLSQPNSMVIEPGITIRGGFEPFKCLVHLGFSFNSNKDYPQDKIILSIGLVAILNSSIKHN